MPTLTEKIRAKARELGFAKMGVARAEALSLPAGLQAWLEAGYHGQMRWMEKDPAKRLDPRLVLAGAKSVLSLALNYQTAFTTTNDPTKGAISRYAWGADYHTVLKEKLEALLAWIREQAPDARGLCYVDTGPIMEKVWAQQSGLGWIGRNSSLIIQELGCWVFLGEILLALELEYDQAARESCGTCRKCLDACPTQALIAPGTVDARRCIAYLTIELKGAIPRELRRAMGNRIFGCDACLEVCPWNRFAVPCQEVRFSPTPGNLAPPLIELISLAEAEFKERFQHSPLARAGYQGFRRNVAIALGNSHDISAIPALMGALKQAPPLVRQHAAWALGQIGGRITLQKLETALAEEADCSVKEEIEEAMSELALRLEEAGSEAP